MKRIILILALCLLGSGIIGCAAPGTVVSPAQREEFLKRVNPTKKITILPPVLQYFKRTNLGNEPLPEFNNLVFENVMIGFKESLSGMGYTVKPSNVNEEELLENQELAFDLTHVRNDFNRALGVMSSSRGDVQIRFSPLVNVFAERAQADLILMAQGYGFETSGGKKAKDAITAGIGAVFGYLPSVQFTVTQMVVMLVDGITGELLWANYNPDRDTKYNAKDRFEMEELTSRILAPLGSDG